MFSLTLPLFFLFQPLCHLFFRWKKQNNPKTPPNKKRLQHDADSGVSSFNLLCQCQARSCLNAHKADILKERYLTTHTALSRTSTFTLSRSMTWVLRWGTSEGSSRSRPWGKWGCRQTTWWELCLDPKVRTPWTWGQTSSRWRKKISNKRRCWPSTGPITLWKQEKQQEHQKTNLKSHWSVFSLSGAELGGWRLAQKCGSHVWHGRQEKDV